MADENTTMQKANADTQENVVVNASNTERNTAQEVENTQVIDQIPKNDMQEVSANESSEANTGAKIREYETPTLHEGVSRLGRLDQAYPDEEREREDLQGFPDGPVNKEPFFPIGTSLSPNTEDLQVKEKGVIDGDEGGNTPLKGTKTVTGTVTAVDPEGGPVQYFFRTESGGQSQEIKLTYGTMTLDRQTGEFEYNLRNRDKDTNGLNQGERVTDTAQVYVMDEDGLEGSAPLSVNITIEGANDKPVLTLPDGGAKLFVKEGGSHMPDYFDRPPVVEDPILKDGDKLMVNDPDSEAQLSYAIAFKPDYKKATESDMEAAFDAMDEAAMENGEVVFAGSYGRLSLNTDTGKYTYHLNPKKADPLRDWDESTEEFTIYVRDEHGAWDSKNITVNIDGGNDTPELVEASGALTLKDEGLVSNPDVDGDPVVFSKLTIEGQIPSYVDDETSLNTSNHTTTARGSIKVSDVDTGAFPGPSDVWGDWIEYHLLAKNGWWANKNTLKTDYGTLTVKDRTGKYTYELNTEAGGAVDALAEGEWYNEHFYVQVQDTCGIKTEKPFEIIVHIEGTNEAPTLSIERDDANVKASGVIGVNNVNTDVDGVLTTEGRLVPSDVDNDASFRYGIVEKDEDTGKDIHTILEQGGASHTYYGMYGNVTLNADGTYVFTLQDNEATRKLPAGAMVEEKMTFVVYDEHGAWAEQELVIPIEGSNNAPTVSENSILTLKDEGKVTDTQADTYYNRTPNRNTVEGKIQDLYGDEEKVNSTTHTTKGDGSIDVGDVDTVVGVTYRFQGVDEIPEDGIQRLSNDYGTITLNTKTGDYTYTLETKEGGVVDRMQEDEWHQETFMVAVADNYGAQAENPHEIIINIEGTNDTPDLQVTLTEGFEGVQEPGVVNGNTPFNGILVAKGTLVGSDIDTNPTPHSFRYAIGDGSKHGFPDENGGSYSITTSAGIMTLHTDGSYVFEFTKYEDYNAYPQNEAWDHYVTFYVYDEHGAWREERHAIEIKGTNDKPVLTVTPILNVVDTASEFIESASATSSDPDWWDTKRYSLGHNETDDMGTDIASVEGYGSVTMDQSTGQYAYTLDRDDTEVKALHAGEILQDSFVVYVTDKYGATDSKVVNVTITGANDAPVFATDSSLITAVESGVEVVGGGAANGEQKPVVGDTIVTGRFKATDADEGDKDGLEYSFINISFDEDETAKTQTITTANGVLVLYTTTGAYTYTPNQDAIEHLLPSDSILEKFDVQVKDNNDLTDETSLLVTIQGTNDAPVIDKDTSDEAVKTDEDADGDIAPLIGFIVAKDVDHTDSELRYSLFQQGEDDERNRLAQTLQGEYGYIDVNPTTGQYSYYLNRSAVQFLGDGESREETFIVRAVDDLYAHDDITLVITINGLDDAPSLSAEFTSIKEDTGLDVQSSAANPFVKGQMDASDIDEGDTPTFSLLGIIKVGDIVAGKFVYDVEGGQTNRREHGTLFLAPDGSYTYTLTQNNARSVQTLNEGQSLTDTFYVRMVSGGVTKDTTLTVQIDGTNDAPELTGGLLGTVTENSLATTFTPSTDVDDLDFIGAVDIDKGAKLRIGFMAVYDEETGTYVAAGKKEDGSFEDGSILLSKIRGEYGTLEANGDGTYTYTVDRYHKDVDGLEDGDTPLEDDFLLTVLDEHGAKDIETVTVRIKDDIEYIPEGERPNLVTITDVSAVTVTEDGYNDDKEDTSPTAQGVITLIKSGEPGYIHYATPYLEGGSSSLVDAYGTLTISMDDVLGSSDTGNATYTYTLHQGVSVVDALAEGEKFEIKYPVFTDQGSFDADSKTYKESSGEIVITIVGTNDAPRLEQATYQEAISETADIRVLEGQVKAHDVDTRIDGEAGEKEPLTYSFADETDVEKDGDYAALTTDYGTMRLNTKTGDYTYTLFPHIEDLPEGSDAPYLADLPFGSDKVETFAIVVSDNHPLGEDEPPVTATVTVTIEAENTAPTVILTPLSVTEDVVTDGHVQASGTPTVTDPDTKDGLKYSIADADGKNSATVVHGTYGSLILNKSTGEYRYILDAMSELVQTLGEGQSETDKFTYMVTDAYGDMTETELVVTINGANDAPVVTVDAIHLFVQEPAEEGTTATSSGQASVRDIDVNDMKHVYSLRFGEGDEALIITGGSDKLTTLYGFMTLTAEGKYVYTLDPNKAKVLTQGETVLEHVTLLVQDVHTDSDGGQTLGSPVEQDITITLTGTNTAPEFLLDDSNIAISDARGEGDVLTTVGLAEDGLSYIFTGTVSGNENITDVDSDAADLRYSIDNTTQVQVLQGDYGSLKLDSETGAYTYTIDKKTVTALGADENESVSDDFTIVVRDEYGATDQQQLTMEITGVNDAPTLSTWGNLAVTEDGYAQDSEYMRVNDVDEDDMFTFGIRYGENAETSTTTMADEDSNGDVSMTCLYGTFTVDRSGSSGSSGYYRFAMDNAAVQELGQGESVTERFWLLAEDSGGNVAAEFVEVTINGANDAPTFDAAMSSTVLYDEESSQVKGELVAEDVDKNDNLTFSLMDDDGDKVDVLLDLVYGSVAVEDDGSYTYTLKAGVDLEDGVSDSFTVDVFDEYGGVDTATIQVEVNSLADDVGVQKVMAEVTVQA